MRTPFCLFLLGISLTAQPPVADVEDLQALLNTPITVASKKATTSRESPGIVSFLTRDEILASGARDLIDVLRLVPGFDFGADVQGVVGASMRGLWGYEGKILLLWDGVEMNESLYGTTQFGNHYPVDQIKRIEIIRGPGSAIYGGYAEVAVIQITTIAASDIRSAGDLGAGIMYGHGTDHDLHKQAHLVYGLSSGPVKFSLGAFGGKGQRTDQDSYYGADGRLAAHAGNWNLEPLFVNVGLSIGRLQTRLILDQYRMTQVVQSGDNLPYAQPQRFTTNALDICYDFKLSDALVITPFASRREQKPWWSDGNKDLLSLQTLKATRDKAGIGASWDATPRFNLLGGLEYQRDEGEIVAWGARPTFLNGTTSVAYKNQAAFAQATYNGSLFNLTLGARAEKHSSAGSSFVPRMALTKVFDDWHFKVLYAYAFRSPDILNLEQGVDPASIEPEKTRTFECEVGRRMGSGLLTINLFDIHIDKPLVYRDTGYRNFKSTGSRGAEIEYKLRQPWGFLNANLAFHKAMNEVDVWATPSHPDYFLGFANVKSSVSVGWWLMDSWTLGSSVVYQGKRYGYDWIPERRTLDLRSFDPDWLINVTLSYTQRGLTGSLGLFDILNRRSVFIQPFNGGQPPIPGASREVVFKLRYGF